MLSDKNTKNMVNIPRYVDDLYYRYTMPQLKAKVEGRGNGIKTVIENMTPISHSLARPPAYMTKYFGFELGAQTICDEKNDRWIVNGKHEEEDLAKLLDDFIEKYILCKKCRNPETIMVVKKNSIELHCAACSTVSPVDTKNRLAVYIQKCPPSTKTQYDQQQTNQKEEDDEGMGTIEDIDIDTSASIRDDVEEDEWKADFSEEAVERRRRELLGGNDKNILSKTKEAENGEKVVDPMEELASYLNKRPLDEDIEILKKIKLMADENNWSKSKIIQVVFGSLFNVDLMTNIAEKAHILSLVATDPKAQQIVLFLFEKLCERDKSVISNVTNILNVLYDEEVVDEDIIMKWYKHPTKKIDVDVGKEIRSKASPFIDWLENASFSD